MSRFYRRHERLILGLAMVALFLLFWEGLSRGWWADLLHPLVGAGAEKLRVRPIFLSSPSGVAVASWRLYITTGEIWPHLAVSGFELVCGLAIAMVLGIPLGLVTGRFRFASYAVEPFISALNATPQVAFLPLIVLWLGTGLSTRIVVIVLLTVLPIFIAAHASVRTIDKRLLTLARSFGSSEWFLFRAVVLPASAPFLLAGLRLAVGRAMIGIVVGELYGSAVGVGLMINKAGSTFQTDTVFVGVLTIVVVGMVLTELLRHIEARIDVWRPRMQEPAS